MGVHILKLAVHSILARQTMWEEQTQVKTSTEYLKKK